MSWLQVVIILFAAGAVVGAGLVAIGVSSWVERLNLVTPRARFMMLSALALLPAALGSIVVMVSFLPSVLDALGLAADHCSYHSHHTFHLCFIHGTPPPISPLILTGCAAFIVWIFAGWKSEFAGVRRAGAWNKQLKRLGHYDAEIDGWMIASERPIAVAIGLIRPKFCISRRLRELLSARQLEAVIAHEKAHIRRYDALVKLGIRLGAKFHFSPIRTQLLGHIDLACEQACDEAAADAIGDRLTVAEAIVAMKRACDAEPSPALALGFGIHSLEERVRGMLDGNWRRPNWLPILATCGVAACALILFHDALHHAFETLTFLAF
ncbi:M56 family metallopeptidase [Bradymonas sediminis]|uniref:M56 family metallopeptidase n=1 Tax=Bradymonas sediminis TaxID=1548548 RepID=UPI0013A6CA9E|nr:M56 family metallopeptidase [Bradymonas sediminis]